MSELQRATRRAVIGGILAFAPAAALALSPPADVGFAQIKVPYGDEPALDVGVWYPGRAPAAGCRFPMVALSHGGGGSFEFARRHGHCARQGRVRGGRAEPSRRHLRQTESQVLKLWRRPDQLHRVIDHMLGASAWRGQLDPAAVGAFGFSNGGFTVLVAAGGRPDLGRIATYCEANPSHDLCQALSHAGVSPKDLRGPPPDAWVADPENSRQSWSLRRPSASPSIGRASPQSASPCSSGARAEDRHQPPPGYEDAVLHALPRRPSFTGSRTPATTTSCPRATPASPRRTPRSARACPASTARRSTRSSTPRWCGSSRRRCEAVRCAGAASPSGLNPTSGLSPLVRVDQVLLAGAPSC